jgi:hypothetical protein
MKNMPRVATFLKGMMNYHTTYPTEKEAMEAKKQPKVSLEHAAPAPHMIPIAALNRKACQVLRIQYTGT